MEENKGMLTKSTVNFKPILSVIVPVYNAEKYLDECIRSILNQTFTDLELILVDDGSKDSSYSICKTYAKKDERIKVFHKENAGSASARNEGLRLAEGTYVTYVDADDWIEPGMYKTMLERMKNENADIVICGFLEEYKDHTILRKNGLDTGVYREERMEEIFSKALYTGEYNVMGIVPSLCNKIFKKESLLKNQLDVCSDIYMGEDGLVTYSTLLDASCVVICNEEYFYHYRILSDSKAHVFNLQIFHDAYILYAELQRICKLKNNYLMYNGLNYYIGSLIFLGIERLLAKSNHVSVKEQYSVLKNISQNNIFQKISSEIQVNMLPHEIGMQIEFLKRDRVIRLLIYVFLNKMIKRLLKN